MRTRRRPTDAEELNTVSQTKGLFRGCIVAEKRNRGEWPVWWWSTCLIYILIGHWRVKGGARKKRTNKGHLIHRVCSFVFIVWVAEEKGESPTN